MWRDFFDGTQRVARARKEKQPNRTAYLLQKTPPRAASRVQGFHIALCRKQKSDGTQHGDIGEHFEITIHYDGTNSDYRHIPKQQWRILLTHALLKSIEHREWFSVFSFPEHVTFAAVEIIEEDASWCRLPVPGGKDILSVIAWVVISFGRGKDTRTSPEKWGIAVRPK